ncbi:MAG: immunoglobulin domain-containing protein [Verrucomicrobia bacterium]|nr:immunoglobulin domain-containing protein [Verrucomicrobiota bacterium]
MKSLRLCFALTMMFATAVVSVATIGTAYQMQLGNPSSATTTTTNHDHYLIQRDQYAMDYSDANGEPNWVSWDLTIDDVGSSGRSNFIQDTTLPAGFYQVLTTDYSGSGYDRGHMCPSADRTVTVADNQIVFYMSNMIPQAPDNNQGVWANFESYCRSLASAGNEVLITCGPSSFSGSRLPSGAAAIPGYVWKIVVVVPNGPGMAIDRITTGTRVIAVKIPNIAGVRSDPWQNYITTVAQIEADTGFTFFTNLPPAVASVLRNVVDSDSPIDVPVITTQPTSQTTVVGGSATFTVAATGTAPLAYQWFKDDVAVDGATSASLALNNVQAADVGQYDVVVSNASGSVTSNAASLIVTGIAPTIVTQPSSVTVNAGTNVTLAVTASGSPTLNYQWRKDGSDLPGATSSALVILDAQAGNGGIYDVRVWNSVNTAYSAQASVVVNPAAPTISTQPANQTVPVNGNVTFSVVATGTEPLTYQWQKGGSDIGGANGPSLTLTGVTSAAQGDYQVVITNSVSTVTSNPASLVVTEATPSTIYWNFGAGSANAAPTSGLPADVTGGTVTQGNNNGTTTLLTTTSASGSYTGASGGYNAGAAARIGSLNTGASGSAYFEFTLTPNAGKSLQVTGITFGSRSTSTGPQAYTILASYDSTVLQSVGSGTLPNNSAWVYYSPAFTTVTAGDGSPVTFRIYGYNGAGSAVAGTANWRIDDLKVTVATLASPVTGVPPTLTSTTPVNGATDVSASSPITLTFSAPVTVTGPWFTITSASMGTMAATVTGGPSTFTLTTPISFANSDTVTVNVLAAQIVDKATGTAHPAANTTFSFTTAASSAPVAPSILTQPTPVSAIVGDNVTFTVAPAGTAPFSYAWRKNGAPISGNSSAFTATLSLPGVTLSDQGGYDCVVTNVAGNIISNSAALTVTALPPTITTQPASQTATLGGSATFTVGVAGTAPFAYQWSRNDVPLDDGAGISGAHGATLLLSPVAAAQAGAYKVTVTNSVTSVTSNAATLAVATSAASTIKWNFTTAAPSSGLPADLTDGVVSQGNNNGTTALLTAVSVSSGYTGATAGNNAGAAARIGALNRNAGGSAYFEFTLRPGAAAQLVVSALSFGTRSTGTGPQAFALYSSADGFAAAVATGTLANNTAWSLQTPTFAPITGGVGAPVTFRLYGYAGTGSPTAGTANWRIDDLGVTAWTLATPPVVVATSPAPVPGGVAVTSPITITFNQPVAAAGAWVSVTSGSGPVGFTVSGGPTTFTLTPSNPLPYNDTITVAVAGAQVTDAVSGYFPMAADYTFSFMTSLPPPPVITTQPTATTATVGDTVTLTVAAYSPVPMTYEWQKDGEAITDNPSAATPSLTFDFVHTANAGSYVCRVSNLGGTTPSDTAALTVNKAVATVTLGQLDAVYSGAAKAASVTTAPAGLACVVTYDGSPAAPVNAGSYAVLATVDDVDYLGSASGTLVIHPAPAVVELSHLFQAYDGTPRPVDVYTFPTVTYSVTYDGGATVPVLPGSYDVVATVTDPNYAGSATGTLRVGITALSGRAPAVSGTVEGSVQVITAESFALAGNSTIAGDLLLPGTPTVKLGGKGSYGLLVDSSGADTPAGYIVSLNGNAVVGRVVRHVNPGHLPAVAAPPAPAGTRSVQITQPGGSAGDFATLRDLTLTGAADHVAVPAGHYGAFKATSGGFVLGVEGATEPSVYSFESLALNGGADLQVAGPVIITLPNGVTLNGPVGNAQHPEYLTLQAAAGDVTINNTAVVHGTVVAPKGAVTLNAKSQVHGTVAADRVVINGDAVLAQPAPVAP